MNDFPPIPLDLPPEPEPYQPGLFAGRQSELDWVQRKIREGSSGRPITQPVVHVWGLRGIGKSWLLRRLEEQYRFPGPAPAEGKSTYCALADFAVLRFSHREPQTVADLLETLARQVREQFDNQLPQIPADSALREGLEAVRAGKDSEATDLAGRFANWIGELSGRFVFLLLLDSVEVLSGSDFSWLESHLIEPIARTDRAIIVVAGRKEIFRWREFSVRQRLAVWELRPFSAEETQDQLGKRGYESRGLPELVHSLSFGLPYANQVLGMTIGPLVGAPSIRADFEAMHREEVLTWLGQIQGELLRDVRNEEHRRILQTLSVLRRFNIEAARFTLSRLLDERYGRQGDAFFLRLFEELEFTNLVWWSVEQRGYVMAAPLRRSIDLRIQKSRPDSFIQRHKVALEMYRQWMGRYPGDSGPFLLEALYHLANAQSWCAGRDRRRKEIDELLNLPLTPERFNTDSAEALLQSLDRDEDLKASPAAEYDYVLKKVQEFRDSLSNRAPRTMLRVETYPYRPEEFVARESEIEMVRMRAEQACASQVKDPPILHFYGTPGIGKSWLLNHLAYLYGKTSELAGAICTHITLFFDCREIAQTDDPRATLFRFGVDKLKEAMGDRVEVPQDISSLTRVLLNAPEVKILLFDAANDLKPDDFGWLEEHFLEPLARSGRAVIVVSGRENTPQWRRFETRRRLCRHALGGFTPDDVAKQVHQVAPQVSAMTIYRFSGGHPYAARLLATATSLDDATVTRRLQPVAEHLLRDIPAEYKGVVEKLTALRCCVNIAALRFFFSRFIGRECEQYSDAFYLAFLNDRLGNRDRLVRDPRGQYYFLLAVRSILQQYLRLARPRDYVEGHEVAGDLYIQRMRELPADSARWLAEWLYHKALTSSEDLVTLYELCPMKRELSADQARELRGFLQEDEELRDQRGDDVEGIVHHLERQGG